MAGHSPAVATHQLPAITAADVQIYDPSRVTQFIGLGIYLGYGWLLMDERLRRIIFRKYSIQLHKQIIARKYTPIPQKKLKLMRNTGKGRGR